ncbi:hypothetical protein Q1695_015917 [Nippostrongylus brasiliensis]|nr:hypothetical protein Q1695_015917 [Nippostrongylus brasiliensis]
MNYIFKQIFTENGWKVKTNCMGVLQAQSILKTYLQDKPIISSEGVWCVKAAKRYSDSPARYYGEGARTLYYLIDQSMEYLRQVNTTRLFGCATACMRRSDVPSEELPFRCALVCVIELKDGEVCK